MTRIGAANKPELPHKGLNARITASLFDRAIQVAAERRHLDKLLAQRSAVTASPLAERDRCGHGGSIGPGIAHAQAQVSLIGARPTFTVG